MWSVVGFMVATVVVDTLLIADTMPTETRSDKNLDI